jgi:hypothetical protein
MKKKSKVIKKKLLELNESVKYSTVRVVARPLEFIKSFIESVTS